MKYNIKLLKQRMEDINNGKVAKPKNLNIIAAQMLKENFIPISLRDRSYKVFAAVDEAYNQIMGD